MLVRERVTLASGLLWHTFFFFYRPLSKAARIALVDELLYLRANVSLAGGLRFSLVNAPGRVNPPTRVNVLIVSRPFDRFVNPGYLLTSI